jgi:cytochrome c-type biogenesis protein CcmH/NrfG
MKNKETVLFVVVALIVGLLVGVIVSKGKNKRSSAPTIAAPQVGAPVNAQQTIQMLEKVVASDPKNRNAWVELGNTYFDAQMPAKSVEAYAKALELNPNDPNVLTDQGVMFRQLGWFDKAIENFTKANEIDPRHIQSLFNIGIVYRHDLQDYVKATEVWKRYLEANPTGETADRIRAEIRQMEAQPLIPAGQMRMPPQPK